MPKIISKIPKTKHPIEFDGLYKEYLTETGMEDPDSSRNAMVRILREMQPCALADLTQTHIHLAMQRLTAYGYNPSYISRMHRALLAFLTYARQAGGIASNPAQKIKPPKNDYMFIPKTVEEELQVKFHDYMLTNATHEQLILWAAFVRGARISEVVMAKISDIRLDLKEDQPYLKVHTKTRPHLMQLPVWLTETLKAVVLAAGEDTDQFVLQFPACSKTTMLVRTSYARNLLNQLQKRCFGEVKFRPKDMRSDYITRYLANSKDASACLVVANQCGNSVDVIQKHYYDFLFQPKDMKGLL